MVRHNSVILLIIAAIGVMSSVACASPAVLSASSLSPGMSLSNVRFQKSFLTANIPVSDTVTPLPASEELALSGVSSERIARIRAMFIGDIHGNYTAFVALLKRAGYVNDNLEWIAGDRILVQLGDIVDRGPEEDALKTWDLLDSLQKQARRAGGEVVRLIGNHEFFYVSEYYKLHPERAIDNGMYVAINSMLRFNFTAANRWRYKILREIEDGDIVAAWQYQDSIVTHA
ncbi:MAG: metallophosphoesterase, partial [Candidatus Omnitrophica bacterium]|nr:metallophosphoesterase [Candidatus Omnitrophota bacterium]